MSIKATSKTALYIYFQRKVQIHLLI